jgi:phosphoribosylglycinamide formyltransferase-1
MKNIVIFASGAGSNAQAIVDYFRGNEDVSVVLILSNKAQAGVLKIAQTEKIDSMLIDKQIINSDSFLEILKNYKTDLIVLAGYLWKIPDYLIKAYENKIVNIHPSLLPKYGGKGMYGQHVHQAVIENKESESGITIHLVNEEYDKGKILLQEKVTLDQNETSDTLASKIHKLEHLHFAKTIENLLD